MDNPVIDEYGTKEWRDAEGSRHRDDGPAVEFADGTKLWYQHGLLHRDDGPAAMYADGDKLWWSNNERISFDEWLDEVDISDEAKVMMKLIHG
jgi:hypothetical protein